MFASNLCARLDCKAFSEIASGFGVGFENWPPPGYWGAQSPLIREGLQGLSLASGGFARNLVWNSFTTNRIPRHLGVVSRSRCSGISC